jgi:voltage-gated potassium channel
MHDFDLPHGLTLVGDATSDDVLKRAGIDRARGLVTVMASDADNLFATLSARLLRADLFIVARAEAVGTEAKLVRAGANRVVSPYQIGGTRVAQAVLRPTVVDFIELATRTEHIDLQLEETCVAASSSLAGASLKSSRVRADLKIIIVAIKKHGGHMNFNPASETVLEPGDTLVAMGNREHLSQLQNLANPQ